MKKESSTKKEVKKSSSSKKVQKTSSKPKKKNPISKYSKSKTELVDYFPRGSGPKDDFTSNIGIINPSQKNIFLSKKRKQKVSIAKKEKENDLTKIKIEKQIEKGEITSVMAPKFRIGDLVLVSICEIHKDYMIMNYTRNKKAMVHSSYSGLLLKDKEEDFNFENYFNIGQFLIGAVVSPGNDIRLQNGRLNKKIQISIDPKIINTGLIPQKIVVGMDLYGQLNYNKNNNKYFVDFKFSKNKKNEFEDDISEENEEEKNIENDIEINLIDNNEEEGKKILKNKIINSYYFFKVIKVSKNSKNKKLQIDISLNIDKYHFPIKSIDFNSLRPGFLFKANVIRNLINGVEISFGSNIGSVFIDQMPNEKKEKNIMVRIIHLSLNKKMASLSALSNIKKLYVDNIKEKEELIGISCSAQITKILYGGSCQSKLILKNEENNKEKIISENAFLHIKNFPEFKKEEKDNKKNESKKQKEEKMDVDEDNEEENENESNEESEEEDNLGKKIKKEVKEGDLIEKVIIKEYNYFDDKPIITTNIPKDSEDFISYDTLKVGQFITGIIHHIDQNTIYVIINNYIEGQIPLIHITDYPLNKMPLKFKIGQKIKARIFSYQKDTKNLILTLKETLQSPDIKLYSNINEMHDGESVYVVYLGNGLYSHSNNIIGTLKNSKNIKEKELKIGKLYKFNVFKINYKSKKILFTKDNEVWVPNCGDYESFIRRNQIMSNIITVLNTLISSEVERINEGDIYDFSFIDLSNLIKILIKKGVNSKLLEENQNALLNEFLVVKYINSKNNNTNNGNYYGFLIKEQISDYFNDIIFKKMQKLSKNEGENISTYKMLVLYHDKESKNLFVSMKQSLIDNRNNILHINEEIKDINEQKFEQNKIYFGFINKKNDKGIMVQIYGKKKLLIKPKDNTYNYIPGQTIICKYRKNKFCINSELFFNYTKEEYISESSNKLFYFLNNKKKEKDFKYNINQKIKDGDIIEITILSIENEYILGKDENNNEIYICCNLYDFSYKQSEFNLDELSIGSKINIKIKKINNNKDELIIGEMPEILLKKLLEKGEELKSEYDSDYINIGDEVLCRITAVKSKYIYTLINNRLIGKMDIENYQGNLDKIKKLLKETIGSRKMSVESKGSASSDVTNNYPKELLIKAEIIDIIKLQNKINENDLGIKKKKIKKLKIYKIVPYNDINEIDFEDDENIKINSGLTNEPLSVNLDITGKEVNIGIISDIKPLNKYPILLKMKNNPEEDKLQIPFNEIPINMIKDDGEIKYKLGQKIKFLYEKKNNLIKIYNNNSVNNNNSKEIKIGQKYLCRILKKLDGKGLIISIRKGIETFVDICEITDYLHYDPLDFYKLGQIVKCRILSFDEKTSKYFASLRHSIINDEEYDIIQNGSTIKFAEKFSSTLEVDLRNKIIKFGENNIIKQNIIAIGYIISSSEKGIFIKLGGNVTVRAGLNELTDEMNILKPYLLYKKNNICICRVISIYDKDPKNIKINVSLKESIIKFPITLHMKDLGVNNFYNCQIIGENKEKQYFVVNIIGSTFTGKLSYINKKNKNIKYGQILILQLILMEKENKKYEFSELLIDDNFDKKLVINKINDEIIKKSEENLEIYKNIQNIITEAAKEKEMQELIDMNIQGDNEEGPEEIDYETLIKRKRKIFDEEEEEEEEEENEDNNEEDENDNDLLEQDKNVIKNKEKIMKILTNENEEENENESKESDEENSENMEIEDGEEEESKENKETKKKRVLSKRKEKENLKKEIKIREIEQANLNNEIKNAQYYERLILKDHDNSINWIEYASYILDTLNLPSARQIFERALKIIDIAKTKEKLNIWVAYLNLENIYGNKKTFEKIFERAKEVCDKKLLFKHVIQIYMTSKKYDEANNLYKILTKDYFDNLDIWKNYIEFLFEINNNFENNGAISEILDTKEGLNKSIQVLSKKNQLDIMCWYGQLLYKYNKNEEARNMFDNILKNFPRRKDIWFVYIDKEMKYGKNIDKVRQIFDKIFEIKFKINDLKSIMKKFLEFEKNNCKDEKEFIKAQEKTKEILEKRISKKEDNNEDDNDEE